MVKRRAQNDGGFAEAGLLAFLLWLLWRKRPLVPAVTARIVNQAHVIGPAIMWRGEPTCPDGYHPEQIGGAWMCAKNV